MTGRKHFILLGLLSLWTIVSMAQQETSLRTAHSLSALPHSGQLEYDIDLYHIKDPDFDWTIGLTYTSDGFRPLTYSGIVGDGWTLQTSGSITRETVGIADDMQYEETIYGNMGQVFSQNIQKGLWAVLQDSAFSRQTVESIYTGNFDKRGGWANAFYYNSNSHIIDLESDVYTFSFNGNTGKFIIGMDGEPIILSGDYVDIDLSGMSVQQKEQHHSSDFYKNPIYLHPQKSTITITTLDGYRYTFGGGVEALEFVQIIQNTSDNITMEPDIMSWMLTCVEAPNGRKLLFHYASVSQTDILNRYTYTPSVYIAKENEKGTFYLCDTLNLKPYLTQTIPYYFTDGEKNLRKETLLDSITTSDNMFCMSFRYEKKDNQIYDSDMFSSAWGNSKQTYKAYWIAKRYFLTEIYAHTQYDTLTNWILSYQSPMLSEKGAYTRQYLQRVEHKRAKIAYRMEYNTKQPSTDLLNDVDRLDMYGYWMENPSFGALTGITNPLGLKHTFTYLPCRYDSVRMIHKVREQYISSVEPNNQSAESILHTIAVETISTWDRKDNLIQKKRYGYGWFNDDVIMKKQLFPIVGGDTSVPAPKFGTSSGILNIDFAIDISADSTQKWSEDRNYVLCPYFTPYGHSGIEYSYVREYVYGTAGNNLLYKNILYYGQTADSFSVKGCDKYNFDILLAAYSLQSMTEMRGKLIQKEEYDVRQCLHKRVQYIYPTLEEGTNRWSVGRLGSVAYKIWIPVDYPISQRESTYENNGISVANIIYTKDGKKRIKEVLSEQGDDAYFVQYVYPDDVYDSTAVSDDDTEGLKVLVNNNRIDKPVETLRGKLYNQQKYITDGNIMLYKLYQLNLKEKTDSLNIDTTITWGQRSLTSPVQSPYFASYTALKLKIKQPIEYNDFSMLQIKNGRVVCDERYDTTTTYTYNRMLRMISEHPIGRKCIQYGWDSKWLYITSKTEGAFTKRYTFIPYIGISSETDIRGITTYYKYDALGNMVEIYQYKDGQKVLLKAYMYHYSADK